MEKRSVKFLWVHFLFCSHSYFTVSLSHRHNKKKRPHIRHFLFKKTQYSFSDQKNKKREVKKNNTQIHNAYFSPTVFLLIQLICAFHVSLALVYFNLFFFFSGPSKVRQKKKKWKKLFVVWYSITAPLRHNFLCFKPAVIVQALNTK